MKRKTIAILATIAITATILVIVFLLDVRLPGSIKETIEKTENIYDSRPDRIDVLGLIPGVSTIMDFRKTEMNLDKKPLDTTLTNTAYGIFEIGGYKLGCTALFEDNKMESFLCDFGGDGMWKILKLLQKNKEVSNIEIHHDLKNGFMKKLGIPRTDDNLPMRNKLGVEYVNNMVTWIDKQGNYLGLVSIANRVDVGSLMLLSHGHIVKSEKKQVDEEKSKRF
jgi:hypothetical protein